MILITLELTDKLIDLYECAVREIEGHNMTHDDALDFCADLEIDVDLCWASAVIFDTQISDCILLEKYNITWVKSVRVSDCIDELLTMLNADIKVLHEIKQQLTPHE